MRRKPHEGSNPSPSAKTNKVVIMKIDKWFVVGIIAGILNPLAGIVVGIALLTDKKQKEEGVVITLFSVILLVLTVYLATMGPLFSL